MCNPKNCGRIKNPVQYAKIRAKNAERNKPKKRGKKDSDKKVKA